jgi:hypothetical protein
MLNKCEVINHLPSTSKSYVEGTAALSLTLAATRKVRVRRPEVVKS